jgi:arsenate reductase-like glutaredoxin family protein
MKIYHNPRCKKSRAGLSFLNENGDHAVIGDPVDNIQPLL